ncbi:MAG TPA: late competence development ComFB family protein [Gemmatimonadales bacterium]|nr:late competence development ComFB family protein [Gemmatimonadales bacterium]
MKNVLEAVVARKYEDLLPDVPDACGCPLCREDILVYALNRLPPRYVATLTGKVLSEVQMEADQGKADVTVALMDAFRVVGDSPRHARSRRTAR